MLEPPATQTPTPLPPPLRMRARSAPLNFAFESTLLSNVHKMCT